MCSKKKDEDDKRKRNVHKVCGVHRIQSKRVILQNKNEEKVFRI